LSWKIETWVRGKVTGKPENSSVVMFVNMTYTGNSWTDRVAVYYHDADDIANGEVITIFGTITGFYNLSKERFIPAISAELIE